MLAGIAALDVARADPFHLLHPRAEVELETYAFRTWPDVMLVDFTAADGQPARYGVPARLLLLPGYRDKLREPFPLPPGVLPGSSAARLLGLNMEFDAWLDAEPSRFDALKDAARARLEFERIEADDLKFLEAGRAPPPMPGEGGR